MSGTGKREEDGRKGTCKGCGADILWIKTTPNNRIAPVEVTVRKGYDRSGRYTEIRESHHAYCPKVEQFRKPAGVR